MKLPTVPHSGPVPGPVPARGNSMSLRVKIRAVTISVTNLGAWCVGPYRYVLPATSQRCREKDVERRGDRGKGWDTPRLPQRSPQDRSNREDPQGSSSNGTNKWSGTHAPNRLEFPRKSLPRSLPLECRSSNDVVPERSFLPFTSTTAP